MDIILRLVVALRFTNGISDQVIIRALNSIDLKKLSDDFESVSRLAILRIRRSIQQGHFTDQVWHQKLKLADAELARCNELGINVVSFLSERYPANLRHVRTGHFPAVLYVMGSIDAINADKSVAIIGTRHPSQLGHRLSNKYADFFTRSGYVTISGLALGIDSNVHKATILAGGQTIAVMAAGLDQPVYPYSNAGLAQDIIHSGGALVSEYPLGTRANRGTFVSRDEWQAALANGVIGVESRVGGGSRHAMNAAHVMDRPLAVPDIARYSDRDAGSLPTNIAGTQEYLDHGWAVALYSGVSVKEFDKMMR